MPILNGKTILALMERKGWSRLDLAAEADVSEVTVRSALSGKNVRPQTQTAIARALGVEPGSLLLHTARRSAGQPALRFRDISGQWSGIAQDIAVPPRIRYDIPPVTYQFDITIDQEGLHFVARGTLVGQEQIRQPFEAKGSLKEDGNYVVMEWSNTDPQVHDYGIALLEYTADAKRLEGYFIGRERVHTSKVIFGEIRAKRARTPASRVG